MEPQFNSSEEEEIAKLEQQLREVAAAESFLESGAGALFVDIANRKINLILKEITSDKYRKDIAGYNNALSELNAYKYILRSMQVAASPIRRKKIKEKLGE